MVFTFSPEQSPEEPINEGTLLTIREETESKRCDKEHFERKGSIEMSLDWKCVAADFYSVIHSNDVVVHLKVSPHELPLSLTRINWL